MSAVQFSSVSRQRTFPLSPGYRSLVTCSQQHTHSQYSGSCISIWVKLDKYCCKQLRPVVDPKRLIQKLPSPTNPGHIRQVRCSHSATSKCNVEAPSRARKTFMISQGLSLSFNITRYLQKFIFILSFCTLNILNIGIFRDNKQNVPAFTIRSPTNLIIDSTHTNCSFYTTW